MTYSEAMNLIDGVDQTDDPDDYMDAWRLLIETEVVYELPGRYGRTAEMLMAGGYL